MSVYLFIIYSYTKYFLGTDDQTLGTHTGMRIYS